MSGHWQTTWEVLTKSRNRATVRVLAQALKSTVADTRRGAIRSIVRRPDADSHRILLQQFSKLGLEDQSLARESHMAMPHLMAGSLRAAVIDGDSAYCQAACQFIASCRDFDLFPALVQAAENRQRRHLSAVTSAILRLVNWLCQDCHELSDLPAGTHHHDVTFVRRNVLVALERSLAHYARHQRRELLEAFLILVTSGDAKFLSMLRDPQHTCHRPLCELLSSSNTSGINERLVDILRDTDAPEAALDAIAGRCDRQFVEHLLSRIRHPVPLRAIHNMKRLRTVAWLETRRDILLELDGRSQAVAVELAAASGICQESLIGLLALLLKNGLAEGRRASCAALSRFNTPETNELIRGALHDPDAGVQAAAVRQLRRCGFADALTLLVSFLESSSIEVRDMARSSLAEFNYVRYRSMFDLLDEAAAKSTGMLVRKVDCSARAGLAEDLASPSAATRLRAIDMAVAMDAADDVRDQLVALASCENPAVRQAAIEALGKCNGPNLVDALQSAAHDLPETMRDAAARGRERSGVDIAAPAMETGATSQAAVARQVDQETRRQGDTQARIPLNSFSPGLLVYLSPVLDTLLGQADWRPVWGRFDHQRPTFESTHLWTVLSIAALLVTVAVVSYRSSRRRADVFVSDSPRRLFRELCSAHRLPFRGRRLMRRLASSHRTDPAVLFVDPSYFDVANLPADVQRPAKEVQLLRARLFD
jgi:HEAT repeat protein